MKIKLIVDGGSMQPGPVIAQQIGPLGINMGKVISDVNSATSGFKGMKVPVELDVNSKSKSFTIQVFSPPVSEMIKKELGLEKGSGLALKEKVGNISFERVLSVAKTKMPNLLAKDLKSAVKLVVGTCVSLGVLIDNKEAKEIESDIESGVYDKEIKNEIIEPSEEKRKSLEKFFSERKSQQEKIKKAEEEAKAAEEAAKAAAATTATTATPTATTPAAAAATPATAKAPAKEEKKETKKK